MRSLAQHVEMEVEHQKVSGHFDSAFLDGMSNVYSNVSNVIVRLRPKPSSSSRGNDHKKEEEGVNRSEENVENESFATLLNAHYDTVPTSAGARFTPPN